MFFGVASRKNAKWSSPCSNSDRVRGSIGSWDTGCQCCQKHVIGTKHGESSWHDVIERTISFAWRADFCASSEYWAAENCHGRRRSIAEEEAAAPSRKVPNAVVCRSLTDLESMPQDAVVDIGLCVVDLAELRTRAVKGDAAKKVVDVTWQT